MSKAEKGQFDGYNQEPDEYFDPVEGQRAERFAQGAAENVLRERADADYSSDA
jgi:hypothetical protein